MANSNVVSFADRKRDLDVKGQFLNLLESDIQSEPSCVAPIPRGIFDEIARIKALAEANKRRELLEG